MVGVVRVEAAVHAHLDVRDRAPGGVFDPGELDRALGQEQRAVDVGEQGAADLVARVGHEVHLPVGLESEQLGRQEPVGDGLALEGAPQLEAPGDAPDAGDPVRVEGAVQPHHAGPARRGSQGRNEPTVDRGELIGEAGHAQVDRPQGDGVAPGRDHPDPQVSNDHLGALREEVEGGLIPLADPLHVHAQGLGELQDAALEHHAVQVQAPIGGPPHPQSQLVHLQLPPRGTEGDAAEGHGAVEPAEVDVLDLHGAGEGSGDAVLDHARHPALQGRVVLDEEGHEDGQKAQPPRQADEGPSRHGHRPPRAQGAPERSRLKILSGVLHLDSVRLRGARFLDRLYLGPSRVILAVDIASRDRHSPRSVTESSLSPH